MQNNQNQPTKKSRGGWFVLLLVLLALAIAATGIGLFHSDLQGILGAAGTETDAGTGGDNTTVPSLPGGNSGGQSGGNTTQKPSSTTKPIDYEDYDVHYQEDLIVVSTIGDKIYTLLDLWAYAEYLGYDPSSDKGSLFRVANDKLLQNYESNWQPQYYLQYTSDYDTVQSLIKASPEGDDLNVFNWITPSFVSSDGSVVNDSLAIVLAYRTVESVAQTYSNAMDYATLIADADEYNGVNRWVKTYMQNYFPLTYIGGSSEPPAMG